MTEGRGRSGRVGGCSLRLARANPSRRIESRVWHMGCISSKLEERKTFRPRWKSEEPVTVSSLQKLRDEFWDTAPHYGGERGEKPL